MIFGHRLQYFFLDFLRGEEISILKIIGGHQFFFSLYVKVSLNFLFSMYVCHKYKYSSRQKKTYRLFKVVTKNQHALNIIYFGRRSISVVISCCSFNGLFLQLHV